MEDDQPDPVREATEQMESQAEETQELSGRLGEHIDKTRSEWERKQADSSVPGALPDEDAGHEEPGEGEA